MTLKGGIVILGMAVFGCGASQNPPTATGAVPTAQPTMAGMDHSQHAAMLADPGASSSATVPVTSAATPAAGANVGNGNASADANKTTGVAASASGAKGTITVKLTTTPANAAKSAVVYLEDAPKDKDVTGTMDNRQMAFIPHVLVATAGAKINFTNSDPFPHNVFSPDNEKWDMGMIPAHGTRVRKFEKPGIYTVLCNVHPNMKAYIVVVPSSYFAKPDKTGELVIHDVPAGKYRLVVWAPGVKTEQQDLMVDGDKSLSLEMHR